MAISQNELYRILGLSKLAADEQTLQTYTDDLNNVLQLLDSIHHIDTDQIKPMVSPLQTGAHLRPDIATKQNNESTFSSFAPHYEQSHFIVPKVIE
ncbi:Asp-tRNA(Asn)/Glu-tRNA(Gln) amidotransferase subunit GatC [Facilibium subflavum]|uniref:Asp-tRNA(Asn)/Glu-tRNA(Gln) amidotransferase subunit GatC n=1 Tax=Facilibium subflavum TaxID=2219058 RepID=UPI000E658195|nr:Asp-tRNA(Asn)/Glu-tRNA(Gln) amidotransferase subunit GatC [Facilibium subflavum]